MSCFNVMCDITYDVKYYIYFRFFPLKYYYIDSHLGNSKEPVNELGSKYQNTKQ